MTTYRYTMDWETTNHEGIIVGCQELTIHYRVIPGRSAVYAPNDKAHPAEPPTVDMFEVTERAWSVSKGFHQVPTDDGTYDAVLTWAETHEDTLLRHAADEDKETA